MIMNSSISVAVQAPSITRMPSVASSVLFDMSSASSALAQRKHERGHRPTKLGLFFRSPTQGKMARRVSTKYKTRKVVQDAEGWWEY